MSYYMDQIDSKFVIKKENFDEALVSLKSVFIPENMPQKYHNYMTGEDIPYFLWVDTDKVLDSKTLEDAMEAIRYIPIKNKNGDIINVKFIGQKYGDDKILLSALAPYIENESYITFDGQDRMVWTWKFDNNTLTSITNSPDEKEDDYFYWKEKSCK